MTEASSRGLYGVLGASPDATYQELKLCYQRAILLCHPDKLPQSSSDEDRAAARHKFCQVDVAWRTLSDDNRRKTYDASQTEQAFRKPFPVNEEVFIDDMDWLEDDEVYTHACRCGGEYVASDKDVKQDFLIITCNTCTLSIQLINNDSDTIDKDDVQPT